MTANRVLAQMQGISEDACEDIDELHEEIDKLIYVAITHEDDESWVHSVLTEYDNQLQKLWGWPQDESKHTLYKKYLFKKQWYGRTFKCNETGETFIIPFDVYETAFYQIGDGFVDVGRWDFYCRFSGVTEVLDEVHQ